MKNVVFYLGLGLLFTHEMDAMPNHEWRVLPVLRSLSESNGEIAFLLAHIPLFALTIGFVASLNPGVRLMAQKLASGFLVIHAVLHFAFSGDPNYEFATGVSKALIFGAAFCGAFYFLVLAAERGHDAV